MKVKTLLSTSLIALVIVLSSCRDKAKPAEKMLVPEDKLVEILTDTYLGDGLMDVKQVKDIYGQRDSMTNYLDILHKYGYTYQQVDSTLKYYFLYKPKKLEKIYDKVTGKLLEIEAEATSGNSSGSKPVRDNLWNGKPDYNFPDDSITDPVAFEIPIEKAGLYSFKGKFQIFPDDESINPRVVIYFCSIDDSGKEVIINWDVYNLKKDGKPYIVDLQKVLENPHDTSIRGWLFTQSNSGKGWKKHARITDISFALEAEAQRKKR